MNGWIIRLEIAPATGGAMLGYDVREAPTAALVALAETIRFELAERKRLAMLIKEELAGRIVQVEGRP